MAWAQVKKPYADYDACPRPMAWARVKSRTALLGTNTAPSDKILEDFIRNFSL